MGATALPVADVYLPHIHRFEKVATGSFMIGFLLMTILNYLASVMFA